MQLSINKTGMTQRLFKLYFQIFQNHQFSLSRLIMLCGYFAAGNISRRQVVSLKFVAKVSYFRLGTIFRTSDDS